MNWCSWFGHKPVEVEDHILDQEATTELICKRCGHLLTDDDRLQNWGL